MYAHARVHKMCISLLQLFFCNLWLSSTISFCYQSLLVRNELSIFLLNSMGCGVSALCEETGPFLVNFRPLAELHDCLLLLVFLLRADVKVDGWKKIDGSLSVTYVLLGLLRSFLHLVDQLT